MLFIQAKNAGAEFKFDEETLKIQRSQNYLIEVNTDHGSYQGKRVILFIGIYNVPIKLEVLKGCKGPNIHYKLENPTAFKGKRCIIVGGLDYAFDTAIQLGNIAEKITVIIKREYAKAKMKTAELAEKSGSEIFYNTEIIRLLGRKTGRFERIQISNSLTCEKRVLEADEPFIAIGFERIKDFLEDNGFIVLKDCSIKVDENLQTNIEGIFAVGDLTGEIRL
jgi:thioredoxin reductase (NADPH)